MYCIAILTDQEQEGQNCAEYIRNYCTEKKVFPLIEIYQDQEQFFERTRKTVPQEKESWNMQRVQKLQN